MYVSYSDKAAILEEPKSKRCHFISFISYVCLVAGLLASIYLWMNIGEISNVTRRKDSEWDFLLFTQSYPISACMWWKQKAGIPAECNFASDKYAWTVHGIWPSRRDEMGPFSCNKIPFNETSLQPILPDLKKHWLSINSSGDNEFWEHEWNKHGTCAVEDLIFDSELTYFSLGLEWNAKYNITDMLNVNDIVPADSRSYSYSDFHDSIKSELGVAPSIACYNDNDSKRSFIQEIRLCFSKSLNLLDCDEYCEPEKNCVDHEIYYPISTH